MEQTSERPTETAEPGVADETPQRVDWPLLVLTSPAAVRVGDRVLPAPARVWIEILTQLTQSALENTLGRAVSLSVQTPGEPSADVRSASDPSLNPVVFGARFGHPSLGDDCVLTIDQSAARVLVEPIVEDLTGLKGGGQLTDAEIGLLEFVLLSAADGVMQELASISRGFAFHAFFGPHEIKELEKNAAASVLEFELRASARAGTLRLRGGNWLTQDARLADAFAALPQSSGALWNEAVAARPVDLYLALPAVSLARQEYQGMQPGDVLLLGRTELTSAGCGCGLVTTTGWQAATAEVLLDSPTVISVRCGKARPILSPALSVQAAPDTVLLVPAVGGIRQTLEQLSGWQDGQMLDLPKDAKAPVTLYNGSRRVATGELVRVEGEVGVRVLDLFPSAAGDEGRRV